MRLLVAHVAQVGIEAERGQHGILHRRHACDEAVLLAFFGQVGDAAGHGVDWIARHVFPLEDCLTAAEASSAAGSVSVNTTFICGLMPPLSNMVRKYPHTLGGGATEVRAQGRDDEAGTHHRYCRRSINDSHFLAGGGSPKSRPLDH